MKKYLTHAGSAVRYASRTTGVDFEKWLTWGAIAGLAYVGYKIYSGVAAVKGALTSTGEAIGSGLFEWVHGDDVRRALAPNLVVRFQDDQLHQVPSVAVDSSGRFVNRNLAPSYAGDGRTYQLLRAKTPFTKNGVTTSYAAVPAGN